MKELSSTSGRKNKQARTSMLYHLNYKILPHLKYLTNPLNYGNES